MSSTDGLDIVDAAQGIYGLAKNGKRALWNVTPRYTLTKWLGGGAYGQVCRGTDRSNGDAPVAIKRITHVFENAQTALRTLREVAILRRLDHPNVVKIIDFFESEPSTSRSNIPFSDLYIVFEDGGTDLKQWMLSFNDPRLPRPTMENVRSLMAQMVAACGYLHRCRVIHRDIKPHNVLIDPATMTVKVADFGLSRVIEVTRDKEYGRHHAQHREQQPISPSTADDTMSDYTMSDSSPTALPAFDADAPSDEGFDVETQSPEPLVPAPAQISNCFAGSF
jgi:mitogen-activated protein kinase 1/3